MSEFMDRARAEAEGRWSVIALGREKATRCRNAFADGAGWAAHQRPTDAEVEAAAKAFHDHECTCGDLQHPDFPEGAAYFRSLAKTALRAAQKVRAGQ